MIVLGPLLVVLAIGFICWLLFTLAVFALQAFVGVAGRRSGHSPYLLAKSAHREAERMTTQSFREETVATRTRYDHDGTMAADLASARDAMVLARGGRARSDGSRRRRRRQRRPRRGIFNAAEAPAPEQSPQGDHPH
jgi:hypothetical protein